MANKVNDFYIIKKGEDGYPYFSNNMFYVLANSTYNNIVRSILLEQDKLPERFNDSTTSQELSDYIREFLERIFPIIKKKTIKELIIEFEKDEKRGVYIDSIISDNTIVYKIADRSICEYDEIYVIITQDDIHFAKKLNSIDIGKNTINDIDVNDKGHMFLKTPLKTELLRKEYTKCGEHDYIIGGINFKNCSKFDIYKITCFYADIPNTLSLRRGSKSLQEININIDLNTVTVTDHRTNTIKQYKIEDSYIIDINGDDEHELSERFYRESCMPSYHYCGPIGNGKYCFCTVKDRPISTVKQ